MWLQVVPQPLGHGDCSFSNEASGLPEHLALVFNNGEELYEWQHVDAVVAARLL